MNSLNYIISKQIGWANRKGIKLYGRQISKGRQTYTKIVEENLFIPLSQETTKEFKNGDGGELNCNETYLAKMNAVHSSSVIGVNVFEYWRTRNITDLCYLLGLCSKKNKTTKEIYFEQKFQISNKFSHSPNIDIVIKVNDNKPLKAFGIECKFSEAYSSRNKSGLKEKYLNDIEEQWNDIPNLLNLAKEISPINYKFKYLDSAQLIKHILGLKKGNGKNGFRLLYLWYDVLGTDGIEHRKEIEMFSKVAKSDNIHFHSISYQELIIKMQSEFYNGNERYLDYLTDRYL